MTDTQKHNRDAQRALRERRKADGLVRCELWVTPAQRDALKRLAKCPAHWLEYLAGVESK